ncbi:MAG: alkaline phosphatase family protein, partial [Deltaproteobacteria bacterium]|nr:alkaline phosphatase family protein [Deltaproteobacteria bacterium]
MKNRVLVIGLDGATFRVMKPLMDEGRLPVMSKLAVQGVRGILESTLDTNSPCAWSTFITGKNPGKHGIFGFFENMPGSYQVRFLNGSFRNGKSLWRILSDEGKRVGVINVPFSYPVEEVNGFMIGGPDSPSKHDPRFCYPKGVVEAAEERIGSYIIEAGANALVRQGKLDEAIERLMACIDVRASTAEYFLSKESYDFFMVVFTESDRVQHHFWKFMNPDHPAFTSPEGKKYARAIYQIYERLDEAVGRLLAAAGDEYAVLIMSDHGAGPASNKTFFLNRWLNTAGYLSFESGMSTKAVIKGAVEKLIGNAYVYVNSRFSRRWKRTLRNIFPGVKNRANSILRGLKIDWSSTKAFSWENAPSIYINVKGKFPHGIVDPGREYQELVARLTKDLLELKAPGDSRPIVEKVVTKEDAYWGPFLDKAPDLFIEWKDDAYTVRPGFAASGKGFIEEITGERLKKVERISRASGVHKPDGIFLLSGPGVVCGREVSSLKLYDVTSMALYYLGVPIPEDFDGRVFEEAFLDRFL